MTEKFAQSLLTKIKTIQDKNEKQEKQLDRIEILVDDLVEKTAEDRKKAAALDRMHEVLKNSSFLQCEVQPKSSEFFRAESVFRHLIEKAEEEQKHQCKDEMKIQGIIVKKESQDDN